MKLSNISLKKNVQYHDHLHPKVWDKNDKLKPAIRTKLVEIAEKFVEFLEIDAATVEDYLVVGSVANYNWNDYSDIDLHILIDFEKAGDTCNDEITEEWLMAKRNLWKERFDITIDGLPVEVGPQDVKAELVSAAVYSVLENDWVKKPQMQEPKINEDAYNKKLKEMMTKINKVLSSDYTSEELQSLQDTFKDMRKSSLAVGGEFSVNNLVYKTLRNQGLVDKIEALKLEKTSEELSL
jgi:hypothetical protein